MVMISTPKPPSQLLKWIGNKQRFAPSIISYFPETYGTYFEPFLGSGAVLGGLSPHCGHASDVLEPLIEIWEMVKSSPDEIVAAYDRYNSMLERGKDKKEVYQLALDRFNTSRRPEEFIFLSRSCYGGVIRFRKADGFCLRRSAPTSRSLQNPLSAAYMPGTSGSSTPHSRWRIIKTLSHVPNLGT